MTAAQIKLFFRTLLKIVPGGPAVGTPGSARVAGILSALDNLVDFVTGAGQQVNVPLLDPTRTDYPQGYQVRQDYSGASYLFFSRNGGGPYPAPPDFTGDNNWGPVAPQTPPTVLFQVYDLSYAQYVLSRFPDAIKPGLLYLMRGQYNGSQDQVVIELQGGQNGFSRLGTLVVGATRTPVKVGIAAGTYSADLGGTAPTLRDVFPSQAKRQQVVGFFTGGTQTTAADVALPGDTGNYFFSEFYDFQAGYWYKCLPNPTQPDGQGNATAWWVRR